MSWIRYISRRSHGFTESGQLKMSSAIQKVVECVIFSFVQLPLVSSGQRLHQNDDGVFYLLMKPSGQHFSVIENVEILDVEYNQLRLEIYQSVCAHVPFLRWFKSS